jgi:hypothetical protein
MDNNVCFNGSEALLLSAHPSWKHSCTLRTLTIHQTDDLYLHNQSFRTLVYTLRPMTAPSRRLLEKERLYVERSADQPDGNEQP